MGYPAILTCYRSPCSNSTSDGIVWPLHHHLAFVSCSELFHFLCSLSGTYVAKLQYILSCSKVKFYEFLHSGMAPHIIQVRSMDAQMRSSPLGYGHLSLSGHPLGCNHSTVTTWRPMPSGRERIQEWFVGGAPSLKHPGAVAHPHGASPREGTAHPGLNRLCLESEASGSLRVRTMCAVQHQELCVLILLHAAEPGKEHKLPKQTMTS
jgi:hypothetical protein